MKRIASICCIGLIAGLGSPAAWSWQSDVHYDLTRHLAQLAGYSVTDAETIAAADQGMDEDPDYNAVPLVVLKIILGTHAEARSAFTVVRQWHFSSANLRPGPARDRPVSPNAVEPRDALKKCENLKSIGRWLHPYQDSWSHQGEPGIAWKPWRANLQWGHPPARKGPYSTHADITAEHPKDAMQMAEATYEALQACAKKGRPPTLPPNERSRVAACFAARSKADKLVCYAGSDSKAFRSRVHSLALENGRGLPEDTGPRILSADEAGPATVNAGPTVPKAIADQALALIDKAMRAADRGPSVMSAPPAEGDDGTAELSRKLAPFLERDRFGPKAFGESPPRLEIPSTSAALRAVSSAKNTIDVVDLAPIEGAKERGNFAAAFQFRHQPYEAFIVLYGEKDGTLTIRETIEFGL